MAIRNTSPTKKPSDYYLSPKYMSQQSSPVKMEQGSAPCSPIKMAVRNTSPIKKPSDSNRCDLPSKAVAGPSSKPTENDLSAVSSEELPVKAKASLIEDAIEKENLDARRARNREDFLRRQKEECSDSRKNSVVCPERLPVKAKASLFEAAIENETLNAMKVRNRDDFLRRQKEEGPSGKRAKFVEIEPKIIPSKLTSLNEEPEEEIKVVNLAQPLDEIEEEVVNETGVHFAVPCYVPQTPSISLPTNSLSGRDDFGTPSSISSVTSSSSSRMYPELPTDEQFEEDHYNLSSSPPDEKKNVDRCGFPLNLSPVKEVHAISSKPSTPMRTLSAYRIEQKVRAQVKDDSQPTVVYGIKKLAPQENPDTIERNRRELLNGQIRALKRQVIVHETSFNQANKAITLSLETAYGEAPHVDAERLLLLSRK